MKRFSGNKGISALPMILLISGIILEVVVAGLVVSQLFSQSILSEQLSVEALKAAESGAQDAIIRVTDYLADCPDSATYNDTAAYCPSLYSLSVGDRETCVSIGNIASGQMTIYSRGQAFTREKTIQAVLGVSVSEAKVEVQSFKEVATPDTIFDTCV
ncbi:MAG: hypothetical protein Q8P99_01955 [bacterium]|nr:hypothetical protein [bacterium]